MTVTKTSVLEAINTNWLPGEIFRTGHVAMRMGVDMSNGWMSVDMAVRRLVEEGKLVRLEDPNRRAQELDWVRYARLPEWDDWA